MNSIKIKLYGNNSLSMIQRVLGIFAKHNLGIENARVDRIDNENSSYDFLLTGDIKRIQLAIRQLNRVVGLQILQEDIIN